MAETAIILPVPDAEPIVGDLRRRYDPGASRGVPPHITLLYPFAPPSTVAMHLDSLRQFFVGAPAFDFVLDSIGRFPANAHLSPNPAAPFISLTESIASRWPQFPPYGGQFSTIVPHLTVADGVGIAAFEEVERTLRDRLPIACRARVAWLLQSDHEGQWRRTNEFVLAVRPEA